MKNKNHIKIGILSMLLLIISFSAFSQRARQTRIAAKAETRLKKAGNILPGWTHVGRIKVDSISIHPDNKVVQLFYSTPLSYIPVRENTISEIENALHERLGHRFKNYSFEIITDHHQIKDLVPNLLRTTTPVDSKRISEDKTERIPVAQQIGKEKPLAGLYNKNIALWDSHGWYYESKLDRWEWQRARLFGTVEDMSTMSFVLPYLVPMLENSGASVFLPRERDWQSKEVIVDNDQSTPGSELIIPEGVPGGNGEIGIPDERHPDFGNKSVSHWKFSPF